MKAYVTKYALTQGILEVEGTVRDTSLVLHNGHFHRSITKGFWHPTRQEAVDRVHVMLKKKKDSIMRQLHNFQELEKKALTFRDADGEAILFSSEEERDEIALK